MDADKQSPVQLESSGGYIGLIAELLGGFQHPLACLRANSAPRMQRAINGADRSAKMLRDLPDPD